MATPDLSEHVRVSMLGGAAAASPGMADIGGTNAGSDWLSVQDFKGIFGYVQLGTWNGTDDLDECRLEQATDAAGANAKDLTTDASAGNYDTANPVDAIGNFVVLHANAADLDVNGGFKFVRLYVAEGGNTGVDNVGGFLMLHDYMYPQKQLQGAAATGEKAYVRPS